MLFKIKNQIHVHYKHFNNLINKTNKNKIKIHKKLKVSYFTKTHFKVLENNLKLIMKDNKKMLVIIIVMKIV